MVVVKLRKIGAQKSGEQIKGLTVPKELAIFFEGVTFTVEKSGCSLIFTSGTLYSPTKQEVINYDFAEAKV